MLKKVATQNPESQLLKEKYILPWFRSHDKLKNEQLLPRVTELRTTYWDN